MRPSLDAVAGLGGALDSVAALEPQLAAVAALSTSMNQLSELRAPMEQLSALSEPMSQLVAVAALLQRPGRLALFSLLGLAAWGIVTFAAVRFAIVSAHRARVGDAR